MNTTARSLGFVAMFTLLSSCSYTAPFRRVESVSPGATIIVTLSAVESRKGQRQPFFADTQKVIADMPNQPGLVGYSFRFQIFGRRAWTMTAWRDEAARDRFAKSPSHLAAVRNSSITAQNMRFVSVTVPASTLPMRWDEALRLLENAPPYE